VFRFSVAIAAKSSEELTEWEGQRRDAELDGSSQPFMLQFGRFVSCSDGSAVKYDREYRFSGASVG
jgi:hypothetical protein